jgi:hypothetical protein
MMKAIVIIAMILLGATAFAQDITCLDKLMPRSRFSGVHQLTKEEWSESNELLLDPESSKLALKTLTQSKLFCKPDEVKIKLEPVCAQTIADIPQSLSCFVFTNIGYFIITKDAGKGTNFVFAKDRKFADPKN